LELYVYGALTEEESVEVTRMIKKHPEVKAEVEEIERCPYNSIQCCSPRNNSSMMTGCKIFG
jgi:hypothetical protein